MVANPRFPGFYIYKKKKISFSSKKKLQVSQLNQVFGLQKWKITILTYTSIFQTIPVGRNIFRVVAGNHLFVDFLFQIE